MAAETRFMGLGADGVRRLLLVRDQIRIMIIDPGMMIIWMVLTSAFPGVTQQA